MQCAVVTPIGPDQTGPARLSHASVRAAFDRTPGPFAAVQHLTPTVPHGTPPGRILNATVARARAEGIDWLFLLAAGNLITPGAFGHLSAHLDDRDALWGPVCRIAPDGRPTLATDQAPATEDPVTFLLADDPGRGHFVRTDIAAAIGFDESRTRGTLRAHALALWYQARCRKGRDILCLSRPDPDDTDPSILADFLDRHDISLTVPVSDGVVRFRLGACRRDLQRQLAAGDFPDRAVLNELAAWLAPGFAALDRHAAIGGHALFLVRELGAGRVLAQEADPACRALLADNVARNQATDITVAAPSGPADGAIDLLRLGQPDTATRDLAAAAPLIDRCRPVLMVAGRPAKAKAINAWRRTHHYVVATHLPTVDRDHLILVPEDRPPIARPPRRIRDAFRLGDHGRWRPDTCRPLYHDNRLVGARLDPAILFLPLLAPVTEEGNCFWDDLGTFAKWRGRETVLDQPLPAAPPAGPAHGLVLGAGGNYYHWLIDFLPRLGLMAGIPDLASRQALTDTGPVPAWRADALALCRAALGLDRLDPVPLAGPFVALADLFVPALPPPATAVAFWRRCIADLPAADGPDRLFVLRRGGHRIPRNQDAVAARLAPLGFSAVDPGSLSFEDQIRLFRQARLVVGGHGAALANLVFCRPGTRVLELWAGHRQPFFRTLCQAVGAGHDDLEGQVAPDDPRPLPHRDYVIPEARLIAAVTALL